DRWAMSRLQTLTAKITSAYERFDFHEVYHLLRNFCVVDMSSFYLDILKDRLYTFKSDSKERRAAQWALNRILLTMTGLMNLSARYFVAWSKMTVRNINSTYIFFI
ncbi:isoleucyl-tRNA synthetase, partial [Candidatus Hakubella thermalkaliphila]